MRLIHWLHRLRQLLCQHDDVRIPSEMRLQCLKCLRKTPGWGVTPVPPRRD